MKAKIIKKGANQNGEYYSITEVVGNPSTPHTIEQNTNKIISFQFADNHICVQIQMTQEESAALGRILIARAVS